MQLFFKDNLKFLPPIGFFQYWCSYVSNWLSCTCFLWAPYKDKEKVLIAGYSCLPLARQQNLKRFTAPVKYRPRNNCDSMHWIGAYEWSERGEMFLWAQKCEKGHQLVFVLLRRWNNWYWRSPAVPLQCSSERKVGMKWQLIRLQPIHRSTMLCNICHGGDMINLVGQLTRSTPYHLPPPQTILQ